MFVSFLVNRVDVQAMDRIRSVSSAIRASKAPASDHPVHETPLLRDRRVDDVGGERQPLRAAERRHAGPPSTCRFPE